MYEILGTMIAIFFGLLFIAAVMAVLIFFASIGIVWAWALMTFVKQVFLPSPQYEEFKRLVQDARDLDFDMNTAHNEGGHAGQRSIYKDVCAACAQEAVMAASWMKGNEHLNS